MANLIQVNHGKPVTTSLQVARTFGKRHDNVMRDIQELILKCSDEFSLLNFEGRDYRARGKTHTCYELTKDAFAMLVFGYTGKKAMQFKESYIKQFNRMESELIQAKLNAKNDLWIDTRHDTKELRRAETDTLKEFIEYATAQGSKGARHYYKLLTDATYQALGIEPHRGLNTRLTLNNMQLHWIASCELVARQSLAKSMREAMPYKQAFERAKEAINAHAEPYSEVLYGT